MNMIQDLKNLEVSEIIEILKNPSNFTSKNVDYHPPLVERIWAPYGEGRLYFHFIHPCETSEALYHPHPWPSSMHIIEGSYEMGLGFDSGILPICIECEIELVNDEGHIECPNCGGGPDEDPLTVITQVSKLILENGSYYEMVEPEAWHYVRPLVITKTVMLTGKPWNYQHNFKIRPEKPLGELLPERAEEIRKWFLDYYLHFHINK